MKSFNNFSALTKAVHELTKSMNSRRHFDVVRYCSERYEAIQQQKLNCPKPTTFDEESGYYLSYEKLLYFDAYWLHQLDQFNYYKLGWIDRYIYEYWLRGKYTGFKIGDQLNALNAQMNVDEEADEEIQEEADADPFGQKAIELDRAKIEQREYIAGWKRAKINLQSLDSDFVEAIDAITQCRTVAEAHRYISQFLNGYLLPYDDQL